MCEDSGTINRVTIRLCDIRTLTTGEIDVWFVGVIHKLALQAAHTAERQLLVTTRCFRSRSRDDAEQ